jgi:predicted small metal-binding protein
MSEVLPMKGEGGADVTVSTKCKGCGVELTADDEEQLVEMVQAHLVDAHPGGHRPSREQVLAVIRTRGQVDS